MNVQNSSILIEPSSETGSIMVYHRDFPEIRAEGNSEFEAVTLLGHQLTRALDSALTDWRRAGLESALADVHAYRDSVKSS